MPGKTMLVAAQQEGRQKKQVMKWLFVVGGALAVFALLVGSIGLLAGNASGGRVALIKISGAISSGDSFLGANANPDGIIGMIEKADKDASVSGILIEINSPGGSAVASEEVMKAVRDAGKPTVALIRDIGTSGAYWVASASDYVVASPVSITGSVGVMATYLEFSEFLEAHGVSYQRLVAGRYKDIGSPFRNLTSDEREILEEGLSKMHDYFLNSVKENRGISDPAALDRISTAVIFLGSEAKGLGLVDELGGKEEAEEWLMAQANLTEVRYVSYEKKPLLGLGSLLAKQVSNAGSAFGKSVVSTFTSQSSLPRLS